MTIPDIDIDLQDRSKAIELFPHVRASRNENGRLVPHPVGIYIQNIPVCPLTDLAIYDYKEAEEKGYFKIDFLNLSVYDQVKSNSHLDDLIGKEPDWSLLDHKEIVENLFHISNHFELVYKLKPRSIEDLAILLALIRPAKRYLIGKDRKYIEDRVWIKESNDEYHFKKSHAFAYAMVIMVQLNLLLEIE